MTKILMKDIELQWTRNSWAWRCEYARDGHKFRVNISRLRSIADGSLPMTFWRLDENVSIWADEIPISVPWKGDLAKTVRAAKSFAKQLIYNELNRKNKTD